MAEFQVTVTVDDDKLRVMAERHLEEQLGDNTEMQTVEQIELELLQGWAEEVAHYATTIWPHMMVASWRGETHEYRPPGEGDK